MRATHLLSTFALVSLLSSTAAQDWRTEKIVDAGIQIDAPSRLERLPMQLGEQGPYHRARLRPKDRQDLVRSQWTWHCDVFAFAKDPKTDADIPADLPPEVKEELAKLLESSDWKPSRSFKEWLDAQDSKNRTIVSAGKPKKGRGGKMDYAHWVWTERRSPTLPMQYSEAAVFTFPDREVALVIEMPLETDKAQEPKSKWKDLVDRMIASGRELDAEDLEADSDKKKDQYANTPERLAALADAKKNIQGLSGWDYFTSPNYIVIYSWDFEKPDERAKAKKDSIYYSSRLEKMRELYLGNYPLDPTGMMAIMPDPKTIPSLTGPVTGEAPKPADAAAEEPEFEEETRVATKPYSVFRLCATYDQFSKYGQSPPGVIGWYSPASKELVVFLGGDKRLNEPGLTETVTYHEGWHQYADFYFHPPQTKKYGELHRWFDEGHGDYFGSFRWGPKGWKYVGSAMRLQECRNMVRVGDYVPFKDLVHWTRQKFYGPRAPYFYAQAFSMIDFFRRGQKSPGFEPEWGEVLDMYRKVMLVHGDKKLASDTAFRNMKDEDWKALEDAWKAWVNGAGFLKG